MAKAVQQLKRESGKGLFVGGVKLPQALAELGLITILPDEELHRQRGRE